RRRAFRDYPTRVGKGTIVGELAGTLGETRATAIRGCQTRNVDPRIARTRRSLQEALFELARERGLDEISVADIAERAGVNRSSFYQHYSDKDTLLADAIDAVVEEAGTAIP